MEFSDSLSRQDLTDEDEVLFFHRTHLSTSAAILGI